jgi:hypothetical protein
MKLLWFFLSIFVGLHSALDMTAGKERRSTLNGTSATILTPDFIETVQEIVDVGGVLGLTLAIVDKTGPAELDARGIKLYQVREWHQLEKLRPLAGLRG